MQEIGIREARRHLAALVDQVEAGGEVVLLRHGRPVARLVPPCPEERRLPTLGDFRATLGAAAGAGPSSGAAGPDRPPGDETPDPGKEPP